MSMYLFSVLLHVYNKWILKKKVKIQMMLSDLWTYSTFIRYSDSIHISIVMLSPNDAKL